jgi:hypothetical protein
MAIRWFGFLKLAVVLSREIRGAVIQRRAVWCVELILVGERDVGRSDWWM